ncbi:MAG TPA: tetratricopeptide repeat protein, partial [Pyrinomonadaceae bacterium]|nr:tetratricopeptide repeat protein [Pyrinomonadaceae bacterium]
SLTGPLPQIGDGPAPRASGGKKLLIGVAVAVLVAGALLMMAAYRASSSSFSTESKLENAIAKGNLVSPAGDSAQHYYNLLRSEGARPDALDRHAARLLPLLTARPFKMLEDLAIPGKNDSSPTEWEEASRLLAWAAELSPQDKSLAARAVYSTGRAAYTRQQTDAALEQWTRAAELDPKWAAPVNGVGLIYNERKQYETARKYLRDAIRRDPNWAVPYNNMGTSYFYERSYDQAAEYYQKAASLAPQWARPHAWLGDIAYERKDFCTARQEYQTALDFAAPGMNNWNPERIQSKRDSAAAKCAQPVSSDAGRERITFGLGGTAASLRGYTSGTNSYVISALANQNMNVWLAADSGSPALRVFDSAMNPLSTGEGLTSWSGTLPYSGDYNILVTSAGGGAAYTLHVTIPPRG